MPRQDDGNLWRKGFFVEDRKDLKGARVVPSR